MIKKIFNIIVVISFPFLVYTLWKADYLKIPTIYSWGKLAISLVLLFIGTIIHAFQWVYLLKIFKYNIKWTDGLISFGLSVFGKYIPGKIWSHLGRSAYIANKYNYSVKKITALSVLTQLTSVWSGALIGFIGFLFVSDHLLLMSLFLGLTLIFGVFIINPSSLEDTINVINRLIPFKKIYINYKKPENFYKVIPVFLGTIIFYALGFYCMADSITTNQVSILTLFAFPIGMVISILSVVFPGGLGIREGSISGYLIIIGFSNSVSATISVFSRLWFLVGEVFIFILALIFKKTKKKNI